MPETSDGGGYGFISISELWRRHNTAVTAFLGDERHEHLERVIAGVQDFLARSKNDHLISKADIESAEELYATAQRDYMACTSDVMEEEDNLI